MCQCVCELHRFGRLPLDGIARVRAVCGRTLCPLCLGTLFVRTLGAQHDARYARLLRRALIISSAS